MTAALQRFLVFYARSLVAYGVAAVLWIVASLLIVGFGVYPHLRYIVELAAVIGLVGVGQTIAVIGGGIDLSVSAVITVTALILPMVSFVLIALASAPSRFRCWSPPPSAQ